MNIRCADPSDATRIACVHVSSWRSAYRGLVSDAFLDGMSVSRRTRAWEEILAAARSTTLVAHVNDVVVGFADYGPPRDEDLDPGSAIELYALYVEPAYWSRGCGFDLWSKMQSLLCSRDFDTLVLWVLEGNQRGRHFYERQGCVLDANARKLWRPETEALVEVRYSMALPPDRDPGRASGSAGSRREP